MAQQTAMQQMYEELMAHEYTIPISLIVKCNELIDVEKEQIMKAVYDGMGTNFDPNMGRAEQYYKEIYENNK